MVRFGSQIREPLANSAHMQVASSDATNIQTSIRQEGDEIVINGHKWFVCSSAMCRLLTCHGSFSSRYISGAGDPRTKVHLVLGKSDPNNSNAYNQQSVVIVPADAPGVKVVRHMMVMGYDGAPEGHSEIIYDNVRVPLGNLVLGWGRGFEVRAT
jgi:acyl-CoA dehydrogenase